MAKAHRGRPPLPPDKRRLTLTVRVTPETMADVLWLAETAIISRGEVVDIAVSALAKRRQR